ncbi:MAG: carboxypeptidase M32 [Promethearchaeota archaeon]
MDESYNRLLEISKDVMVWHGISSILSWDFETYMPKGATNQRSLQFSYLSKLMHQKATNPEIGTLVEKIRSGDGFKELSLVERRNIHLIKKSYDQSTRLPQELVMEIAKHQPISINTWKQAKKEKDFSLFKPKLEKTVELIKKKAHYLNPDDDPYDVLLDLYEPGVDAATITRIFEPLRDGLIGIINKCRGSGNKPDLSFLTRKVPVNQQKSIAKKLMEFVGYNLQNGRLDETEHPFTTGLYQDVRICTHYYENNFASSIYSVLHEAGHGLYEQNIPRESWWTPVGSSCSMGIHESQSRFIENVLGKSEEFWEYFLPILKEYTGKIFDDIDLNLLLRGINDVKPSKIRIEADEVTYSLHVILRFEIERDIMQEKISIDELPSIWNEKMDKYLGIEIQNDSEGVMQDTHWASGLFGYFPDYALGNVYDGMLLEKLNADMPGWKGKLSSGESRPIFEWLKKTVHAKGDLFDPQELMYEICKKEISPEPFIKYLYEKMSTIYGF